MKYTFCIPAALAIALFVSAPVLAKEEKKAGAAETAADLSGQQIKGKVLESMDSGGYSYLRIDASQGKVWVAVPQTQIEVGKEVTASPGMVMKNFTSKTLDKTFDAIVFSGGLVGEGNKGPAKMKGMGGHAGFAEALKAEAGSSSGGMGGAMGGAMGAGAAMAAGSTGSTGNIVAAEDVKVDKATGDNAQTVADCFEKAKELDKKKVQVRGKVMKVSRMIMGKNWIHLQDGTGNPMKNSHDLVVTTQAVPEKGSIVVVEGVLAANKDFGAGYKYDAIIEDAVIK